jgi:proline dehydrogenase
VQAVLGEESRKKVKALKEAQHQQLLQSEEESRKRIEASEALNRGIATQVITTLGEDRKERRLAEQEQVQIMGRQLQTLQEGQVQLVEAVNTMSSGAFFFILFLFLIQ